MENDIYSKRQEYPGKILPLLEGDDVRSCLKTDAIGYSMHDGGKLDFVRSRLNVPNCEEAINSLASAINWS